MEEAEAHESQVETQWVVKYKAFLGFKKGVDVVGA